MAIFTRRAWSGADRSRREEKKKKKGFSRSTQHESPSARFSSFTCGKRTPDASLSLAVELIFLSNISTPAGLFSTLRNGKTRKRFNSYRIRGKTESVRQDRIEREEAARVGIMCQLLTDSRSFLLPGVCKTLGGNFRRHLLSVVSLVQVAKLPLFLIGQTLGSKARSAETPSS